MRPIAAHEAIRFVGKERVSCSLHECSYSQVMGHHHREGLGSDNWALDQRGGPAVREHVKKLMKSYPSVFNPIWSAVYPMLKRSEGYVESSHSDNHAAFETIYQENYWGDEESRSGWGSTLE